MDMAIESCNANRQHMPFDAIFDHRRGTAKGTNKPNWVDMFKFIEGKGAMDQLFKVILLGILTVDEKPPRGVKIVADHVVAPGKSPVAPENRKRKSCFTDQHGDRGKARISEDSKAEVPLSNDRLHHKKGKQPVQSQSARAARARPVKMTKVKEEKIEVIKENENTPKRRGRGRPRGSKNKLKARSDHQDAGQVPSRGKRVLRGQKESMEAVRRDNGCSSKKFDFANCDVKKEPGHYVESDHQDVGQVPSRGKRVPRGQKESMVRGDIGCSSKKADFADYDVKKEPEHYVKSDQDVGQVSSRRKRVPRGQKESMEAILGDNGCSSKKADFANCDVKKEPEHYVETPLPMKGIDSNLRNVERAKCSMADNSGERYVEGVGSSEVDPELVILDGDKVAKKELVSGFVCSKKYHRSMAGEECPTAVDSEFRRELLEVLKKPYDKEEYHNSREAIRAGSYLDYHPGLQTKLTKYRYKRDKLLIIVRGFLFWLQNLTREGSFEPWNDKQCLELELPSR